MKPLVPHAPTHSPPRDRLTGRRNWRTDLIFVLAALSTLTASGLSLFFFLGFAENDPQIRALVPAFLLCFGVGAVAFIPSGYITYAAYKKMSLTATRATFIWAVGFVLPWLGLSCVLSLSSALPWIVGVVTGGLSLVFLIWSGINIRSTPA